jgi:hypothetical protein
MVLPYEDRQLIVFSSRVWESQYPGWLVLSEVDLLGAANLLVLACIYVELSYYGADNSLVRGMIANREI